MVDFQYPKINFVENSPEEKFYDDHLNEFFKLTELLSKPIINAYGKNALQLIDVKVLQSIFYQRVFFNRQIRVNDYKLGLSNRIVRFPDAPDYRPGSEHSVKIDTAGNIVKKSLAVDYDVKGLTAEEVRQTIVKNQNKSPFDTIQRLEKGVGWVHAGFAPLGAGIQRIHLFLP
jgi:hypothetical protein